MLLIFPVLLLGYLLLGLIVSIGVARWSSRRFQSNFAPWAVFAVLFALFFGDEIYGYWNWQNLCKTEGGLHVYKRVPVEGFKGNGLSEGFAGVPGNISAKAIALLKALIIEITTTRLVAYIAIRSRVMVR